MSTASLAGRYSIADIVAVRPVIGMEVHVELASQSKMFAGAASPAAMATSEKQDEGEIDDEGHPNELIDPTVLGLPGALPTLNLRAVELSARVGLALNCTIAPVTKWDRKSYFYPDLPKGYQISQYDQPLCADGWVDVPASDKDGFPDFAVKAKRIRIVRAHLEEDAGKLMHEAPGVIAGEGTFADYNRAGTPLLEIVTAPDFFSAEECVSFSKWLRATCRSLRATRGVMQLGHMRFEPNINCVVVFRDGCEYVTPIVEVKNLNSFRSLRAAIEHELTQQPARLLSDGRVHGPGQKVTRGFDDATGTTFVQREKEDAQDYRYFPDPDILPIECSPEWIAEQRRCVGELPLEKFRRNVQQFSLAVKEALPLAEEPDVASFYDETIQALVQMGVEFNRAGKAVANVLLQSGQRRANERGTALSALGISALSAAALVKLREDGRISNQSVDVLFEKLCDATYAHSHSVEQALASVESLATDIGALIVRDDAAMESWIQQVFAANTKVVEDVRQGKIAAAGRLVGEIMKLAGAKADAKTVREAVLRACGQST